MCSLAQKNAHLPPVTMMSLAVASLSARSYRNIPANECGLALASEMQSTNLGTDNSASPASAGPAANGSLIYFAALSRRNRDDEEEQAEAVSGLPG
jgi:hypothetical protein